MRDERPRDRDALLLAAREVLGQRIRAVAEPDLGQLGARRLHREPAPDPLDQQRHRDVLGGGQRRQQVVLLEDEADVALPELGLLRGGHRVDRLAEDVDAARRRVEDPGDDREERRLPAARGADQQQQLADPGLDLDAAQRVDLVRALDVDLRDAVARDGDAGPGRRGRGRAAGGGRWTWSSDQPRNTMAGSSLMTRRSESRLAKTIRISSSPNEIRNSSGRNLKASWGLLRVT